MSLSHNIALVDDIAEDLDGFRDVSAEETELFQKRGFILLRDILSEETLNAMEKVISARVAERYNRDASVKNSGRYYADAFQQISNIWEFDEEVRKLVFSKKLAAIATKLMGTRGVRLYHDQALYKESGRNHTPWHCDQVYWPLDNTNTITAWIPLQDTPVEMGALGFAAGSHQKKIGRELAISEKSEEVISKGVKSLSYHCEGFNLGDVSFHYGFTLHNAAPNTSGSIRRVMTIIYMDSDMKVAEPKSGAQKNDLKTWLPGCVPGGLCDSPLNPVLYEK